MQACYSLTLVFPHPTYQLPRPSWRMAHAQSSSHKSIFCAGRSVVVDAGAPAHVTPMFRVSVCSSTVLNVHSCSKNRIRLTLGIVQCTICDCFLQATVSGKTRTANLRLWGSYNCQNRVRIRVRFGVNVRQGGMSASV